MEKMQRSTIKRSYIVDRKSGEQYSFNGYIESPFQSDDPLFNQKFNENMTYKAEDLPPMVDLRKWMTRVEQQQKTNSWYMSEWTLKENYARESVLKMKKHQKHFSVANALVGAYEYLIKKKTGKEIDMSRLFIYYYARKQDIIAENIKPPLGDKGCTITNAIEVLRKFGVCEEKDWPFDIDKVNKPPTSDVDTIAKPNVITGAYQIQLDLTEMKSCLAQGFPFVFILATYNAFHKAKGNGVVSKPDPSKLAGNKCMHAMLAVGYSDTSKAFIVRNSWGTEKGDKGYYYVPYDYMTDPTFMVPTAIWTITNVPDFDLGEKEWIQDDIVDFLAVSEALEEQEEIDDDILYAVLEDIEEEYYDYDWVDDEGGNNIAGNDEGGNNGAGTEQQGWSGNDGAGTAQQGWGGNDEAGTEQ